MLLTEGQMIDHKGAVLLFDALPNAKVAAQLNERPVLTMKLGAVNGNNVSVSRSISNFYLILPLSPTKRSWSHKSARYDSGCLLIIYNFPDLHSDLYAAK